MYKHILIATDGSELATKGVDHGLALAKALGANVTVLTVTEPLSGAALDAAVRGGLKNPVGQFEHQMDEHVENLAAPIRKKAADLGVPVQIARETDEFPAEAIVRYAKLNNCDLIVMSSHGRRGAKRLILGSQTAEVVTHTTIPVHVIR
ncbi:MAG TPA: universal stress protein [Xanthobacteraceae bacterium]|jgi:nucleotide-binding universal stress UspA family protein|nr:universal stress protein [Xanthobacteraceae bacterium]